MKFASPALEPIAATLAAMLESDTLPHALLLEGASEACRRDAAIALARVLICSGGTTAGAAAAEEQEQEPEGFGFSLFGEEEAAEPAEAFSPSEVPCETPCEAPCETCTHCFKSGQGIHPDLLLLEGGISARSFHIDAVRGMRQSAYTLPNEAVCKVYVLHGTHTMTVEAQNALLKLLEEPPDYVRIILTVPNRRQLLQTVISRVTTLSLGELSNEHIDEEREALITATAQKLALALLAPKTPYALLEATAPFEGNKDLLRETLPALKRALHGAAVKNPAMAPRVLALIDGLVSLEFAMERNANLNLMITQLAYLGIAPTL